MPIPPIIFSQIMQAVVRLAPLAYRAGMLLRKKEIMHISREYSIIIKRRLALGVDGGISQVVQILRGGKTQEVLHIVVKNGKVIHKHTK